MATEEEIERVRRVCQELREQRIARLLGCNADRASWPMDVISRLLTYEKLTRSRLTAAEIGKLVGGANAP